MLNGCPGASNMRTPTLEIRTCPECGGEVEIFSTDKKVRCGNCGFVIHNDVESCVQWCRFARKCVGEELYEKLKEGGGDRNRG